MDNLEWPPQCPTKMQLPRMAITVSYQDPMDDFYSMFTQMDHKIKPEVVTLKKGQVGRKREILGLGIDKRGWERK